MPVTPTYPGVYIEEISSGVRTITGVATSITAFVGRALRGPIDKPITINSFGDFQRIFGGLWVESQLGLQVQNFFEWEISYRNSCLCFYMSRSMADGEHPVISRHQPVDSKRRRRRRRPLTEIVKCLLHLLLMARPPLPEIV